MQKRQSHLILTFIRNPVAGQVKTRLAAAVGEERALQIYKNLLTHTRKVASGVEADRQVWYSAFIDEQDLWAGAGFAQYLQEGENLGERMEQAFRSGFDLGYRQIVIIGSDCPTLQPKHLQQAFGFLKEADLVLGPSRDGGYYLLGMNRFHPELFHGMPWSRPELYSRTLEAAGRLSLAVKELETLQDIDTVDDLEPFPEWRQ